MTTKLFKFFWIACLLSLFLFMACTVYAGAWTDYPNMAADEIADADTFHVYDQDDATAAKVNEISWAVLKEEIEGVITDLLDETGAADTSGASMIGVYDEFANSNSDNVQDVLDDLDAAISAGGETNTASSQGSGTSIYYQKSGVDLQFNAIKSESDDIDVSLDAVTHDVEFTFTPGNVGLNEFASGVPALAADSVDAITEIAAALKSGSDTTLITGTAGTDGNLAKWNGDGDVIDSDIQETQVAELNVAETITADWVNTANPWADNEVANTQTITAQAGSTWNIADSITIASVYSGTTSLEETTAADDSGAYIIGVYDEFTNSDATNVQDVLDDLDAAISAGGETNTASSQGSGTSIYYQKSGVDLQFNAIKSESDDIDVSLDAVTHDVEFTFTPGNVGLNEFASGVPALAADSVDAITEIAAALKSGSDTTLITGTAGTDGNLAKWNGDGDVIDSDIQEAQVAELNVAETITADWVNTANPWADNEVANAQTITAQAGSTWDVADSVTIASVYSGTTSLEETTAADDSGAYIIGVFDEFDNSNATNIQDVLDDLDAAITGGGGDVTSVGDATSGATLDGTSDGGTYIRLYDGDSHYLEINPGDLSANETFDPTDDIGTGSWVRATSPTLVTPTLGAAIATTLDTGQGAYELYAMNQDVESTDAVTFATVDTGQGANELYDMDQNVLTTSSPTFAGLNLTGSTDPLWEFNDSDAAGADADDEEAARIYANMITVTEDAEDSDFWITIMQGGTRTTVLTFDESDDRWEIPTGKHLAFGTTQWDDGSDKMDGEQIADDSIDDDSIDWVDVTSSDITFDADTIPTTSVYSGTTSLEETTAADDSGAYIIGVYDEFTNSDSTNVQDVLDDLDAAISGGGETNTASSQGSGTSIYYQKSGVDLQFNAIKSETDDISVSLDSGTHDVEFTFVPGNVALSEFATGVPVLAADSVDAITEIAAALKSGADITLITGTAGTDTYTAVWNSDGDLIDGYDPTTKANVASPNFTGDPAGPTPSADDNDTSLATTAFCEATQDYLKTSEWTAASTTVAGKVELATATETTTGTDSTRAVTPDGLAGSDYGKEWVGLLVFDDSQDTATGDGAGDLFFRIPSILNGWNLIGVAAQVQTAGTTGNLDIMVYNVTQAADMLSTAMRIETGETDTSTSAQPGTIDTANDDVATADNIRIDVDSVQTTAAKGLFVELIFQLP